MNRNINKYISTGLSALMLASAMTSCTSSSPETSENTIPEEVIESTMNETETTATPETETPASPWKESKHKLSFGEDGEFRILVFSDIHISGVMSSLASANMQKIVERENPDLVIFDGDNTWGIKGIKTLTQAVESMVSIIEEKQIPWMHVYGNHDCENDNLAKEEQQKVYESFEYCISQAGDDELTGVGNYVIPVYGYNSDKVLFNVWALDSGEYLTTKETSTLRPVTTTYQGYIGSSYAYIKPDQIQWYVNTSKAMEEYNGAVVPGMMAFHIPLQESYNAWVNRTALNWTGEKREVVCSSEINSGLFATIVDRGDIKAVVNGHDHVNDYMVEYGGVKLCYCSTISETGYCDMDMLGARMFVVNESNPAKVDTYMSYVGEISLGGDTVPDDAQTLGEGILFNFDSYSPELDKSGWPNDTSAGAQPDKIVAEIAEGKGIDGSSALAITRKNFGSSNSENNAEVRITLENPGLLGDNKYVRVWMDLSGDSVKVDFRKAAFGLITNNYTDLPFNTDEKDTPTSFWYMAEGSSEWVKMNHGNDGCFGAQQSSSVKGYKGWFAFPISNMPQRSTQAILGEDSYITHFYMYFCLADAGMKGQCVYLDNIELVKDYTVFD